MHQFMRVCVHHRKVHTCLCCAGARTLSVHTMCNLTHAHVLHTHTHTHAHTRNKGRVEANWRVYGVLKVLKVNTLTAICLFVAKCCINFTIDWQIVGSHRYEYIYTHSSFININ